MRKIGNVPARAARLVLSLGAPWVLAMFIFSPAAAFEIEGLPGSTWGQLSYDADRLVGAGAMGYVNQGIDWVKLPGEITFNTFAEFRYRLRDENKTYYNAYGRAVGVELKKSVFRLGMDYYWERFPNLGEGSNKLQFYLTWFYDWNLKH